MLSAAHDGSPVLAAMAYVDLNPVRAKICDTLEASKHTSARERRAIARGDADVLITTPESLYVLLGSESGRTMLASTRSVIVDEIHALAPNKRGSHLALSLERLQALCERRLVRIGLSATQQPIDEVARFLVGARAIAPDGTPCRLGFAIGNEFSDHVTERQNYLYLAHSKLRACAVGPELRSGALPADLQGTSRIRRGERVVWEKPFATGEANMCHTLANLEYHHFKYAQHRRPGDVHLHFFGTATLSFADGFHVEPGDLFEIEQPAFGAALVNPLSADTRSFAPGAVHAL